MPARSLRVTPLTIALYSLGVICLLVTVLAFATTLVLVAAALFGWVL
jgi:hypothetical protein